MTDAFIFRMYEKSLAPGDFSYIQNHMETEFDPAKNLANINKHGLSFEDFDGFDGDPIVVEDTRKDYGEVRFIAVGRIAGLGYMIAYTMRDGVMRLISFRRAHEQEMRRYEPQD